MKKMLITVFLSLMAVAASAAAVALSAGPNSVTTTTCSLLIDDVKVILSVGNVGAYECNASTANIGVAVGSTSSGSNKIFSLSSAAGSQIEVNTSASAAVLTTDVQTHAVTKAASS